MPSSSCLCNVHSEFFNAFNNNLIKMWSSAKKFSEYRHDRTNKGKQPAPYVRLIASITHTYINVN